MHYQSSQDFLLVFARARSSEAHAKGNAEQGGLLSWPTSRATARETRRIFIADGIMLAELKACELLLESLQFSIGIDVSEYGRDKAH